MRRYKKKYLIRKTMIYKKNLIPRIHSHLHGSQLLCCHCEYKKFHLFGWKNDLAAWNWPFAAEINFSKGWLAEVDHCFCKRGWATLFIWDGQARNSPPFFSPRCFFLMQIFFFPFSHKKKIKIKSLGWAHKFCNCQADCVILRQRYPKIRHLLNTAC